MSTQTSFQHHLADEAAAEGRSDKRGKLTKEGRADRRGVAGAQENTGDTLSVPNYHEVCRGVYCTLYDWNGRTLEQVSRK